MSETTAKIWLYVAMSSVFVMSKIKEAFKSMTSVTNMLISAFLGFGLAMYSAPIGIGAGAVIVAGFALTSIAWTIGFVTEVVFNIAVKPLFSKIVGFFKKDESVIAEDTTVKDAQKARARYEQQARESKTYEASKTNDGNFQVSGV